MVAGIIALKESADKAPAPAWLMWGYYLDLVEKHARSRLAAAPGNPDTDTAGATPSRPAITTLVQLPAPGDQTRAAAGALS
jgi:hypothetical protein